jgi:hypothetical protein
MQVRLCFYSHLRSIVIHNYNYILIYIALWQRSMNADALSMPTHCTMADIASSTSRRMKFSRLNLGKHVLHYVNTASCCYHLSNTYDCNYVVGMMTWCTSQYCVKWVCMFVPFSVVYKRSWHSLLSDFHYTTHPPNSGIGRSCQIWTHHK